MAYKIVYRTFDGEELATHSNTLQEAMKIAQELSRDVQLVAVYRKNSLFGWTHYGTCFRGQWLYSWEG